MFNSQFSVGDKVKIGKNNKNECELCEDGEWRSKKNAVLVKQNLFFDYNCLKYLDEKWNLSEREVTINSSYMFFRKDKNRVLFPLSIDALTKHNTKKDRSGWLKSYQAIKHSRIKNQHEGSVSNVQHALATLYIPNIYYRYSKTQIQNSFLLNLNTDIDLSCGSKIFSVTKGDSKKDVFIIRFNGFLELNVNQKVSYVKIDSEGLPIYAKYERVAHSDGYEMDVEIPFDKEQE